ncbi:MAG: DNA repair protein RadC, partial [Rhodospirillaceae bacterium]|nr:DNA repair protein RadC [Rhodospirillaceae bacterium]
MESLLADKDKKPHYHGHRQRLRERFLKGGPDSLPGYELLELILFGALRQGDVKPLAKRLIDQFGSLAAVFSAEISALENAGLGETTIATLKATQAAALHLSRAQLLEEPILSSWQALLDYCRAAMGHDRTEAFRILFLDRRNRLIKDEVQQRGTVDHTPVYPREVVKRALELGATALILVHNHPSGDATPSQADIEMTKKIAAAADPLGIV